MTVTTTNPLMARFTGEPVLLAEGSESRVTSCLQAAMSHPHIDEMLAEQAGYNDDGFWSFDPDSWRAAMRPYVVKDGILQIPVKGVLLHNFPFACGSWATGYDYIWRAFQRGCEDFKAGQIKGIAFICDSPGGMVAGCFDACDKMSALKEQTGVPVRGFAHESAYSACYAIISVAGPKNIVVSRTGGVGSIGVLTAHVDLSGAYEQAGIKITFIFAGKHKVDGNATEPLAPDVKARIQARIDELYDVFVSTVARNRSMDEQAIRDTEAACFTATQALSNGLADAVGSLDDAVSAFADDLCDNDEGDEEMSNTGTVVDQATHEAAVEAARTEGAGNTAGAVAEAVAADRQRRRDILALDEAKGRETLAGHIADSTSMSVDDAKAMLAAAPKQEEQKPGATGVTFEDAMNGTGNPGVGANGGGEGEGAATGDIANDPDGSKLIALARHVGIKGVRPAPTRH